LFTTEIRLLENPTDYLPPFDKAFKDICLSLQDPLKERIDDKSFYVGLQGSFGEHEVRPGSLNALHIGSLISIEGIVTRCNLFIH
jgi:DNA replication licensing factor MCM3